MSARPILVMGGDGLAQQAQAGDTATAAGPVAASAFVSSVAGLVMKEGSGAVRFHYDATYNNISVGGDIPYYVTGTGNYNLTPDGFQYGSTCYDNVVFGRIAGNRLSSGYSNVIGGMAAAYNNGITGYENIIFGSYAAAGLGSGFRNICIGRSAGGVSSGSNNIFIGTSAGSNVSSGTGNIILGPYASSGNTTNLIALADGGGAPRFLWDGTNTTLDTGTSGAILPGRDNANPLGSSSLRFSTIYAGTGSINTSDGTLKTVRSAPISDAERAWARAIAIVPYQFNDSIAAKGADRARMHWGVIAQDVYAAGIAAGIADPMSYAFMCQDALLTEQTREVVTTSQQQVTETITETADEVSISIVDGQAFRTIASIERQREAPVVDVFPVVDEAGAPVCGPDGEPLSHIVPRMQSVDVTTTVSEMVPALDGNGKPIVRWGIRYDELVMFLLACGRG